jgi:GT2 family glycosyltransferase
MAAVLTSETTLIVDSIELKVRAALSPGQPLLTVIVPLADTEAEPKALLSTFPEEFEVIQVRGGTRAIGMNRAATIARGKHLWFVHADTILDKDAVDALRTRLNGEDAIFYFSLCFDGGFLMRITELGVRFRSRFFKLPFGDQALCLSAPLFESLGRYNEAAMIGEDLLLVRRAHRADVPVRAVAAVIQSSARKYLKHGWLKTTWQHLRWTLRLALKRD